MKNRSFRLSLPRGGKYEISLMSFGGGDVDVKHEGSWRGLMSTHFRLDHLRTVGLPDYWVRRLGGTQMV